MRFSRLRVLVADDSAEMRAALSAAMADRDIDVVGMAEDGVQVVELARCLRPDVVLLDLRMPTRCGREAIPLIRAASPRSRIVIYTAEPEPDGDLLARVDGWVSKAAALETLYDAIRCAGAHTGPDVRPEMVDEAIRTWRTDGGAANGPLHVEAMVDAMLERPGGAATAFDERTRITRDVVTYLRTLADRGVVTITADGSSVIR